MTKVRIRLKKESEREMPVSGVNGASYDWDPETRTFTLTYYGVVQQPQHVPNDAVAALVEISGTQASMRSLVPPKDPVRRAAWYNGFYKDTLVKSIEEARASAHAAAKGAEVAEIKEGAGFLFVYRRTRKGGKIVCKPFRWFVEQSVNPGLVWEALFNLNMRDDG